MSKCKIPYVHDFPDYPCPLCSPKEFEAYKNSKGNTENPLEEKCCERCLGSISGLQWWCNDTSCPCHLPKESKELPKGVCPSCWGKKYYTQMHGERGYADFIGDKSFSEAPSIHKYPCSKCNGTGKFPLESKEELSKCCGADKVRGTVSYTYSAVDVCSECGNPFEPQEPMEWESEFDKIPQPDKIQQWQDFRDRDMIDFCQDVIKPFIRTQIKQAEERVRKEKDMECSNKLLDLDNYQYEGAKKAERERIVKGIKNMAHIKTVEECERLNFLCQYKDSFGEMEYTEEAQEIFNRHLSEIKIIDIITLINQNNEKRRRRK